VALAEQGIDLLLDLRDVVAICAWTLMSALGVRSGASWRWCRAPIATSSWSFAHERHALSP